MAEKEVKSTGQVLKGLYDKICTGTDEARKLRQITTNRKKLKLRVNKAYTNIQGEVDKDTDTIEDEREKVLEDYESFNTDVIIDKVLNIHTLTGVNFYTGEKQTEIPTHQYIIDQEYKVLFDESIDG